MIRSLPLCLFALATLPAQAGTLRYDLAPGDVTVEIERFGPTDTVGTPAGSFVASAADTAFFIEFDTTQIDLRGQRVDFSFLSTDLPGLAWIADATRVSAKVEGHMTFDAAFGVIDWDISVDDDRPHLTYDTSEVIYSDHGNDGAPGETFFYSGTKAGPFAWAMTGTPPRDRGGQIAVAPVPPTLPLLAAALLGATALLRRRSV